MRMYTPDGVEALVDKDQMPALLKSGWTKTKPAPVKSVDPEPSEPDAMDEMIDNETFLGEEEAPAASKTGRKKLIKK